jgi:predicted nucleic acid-binding protein
VDLDWARMSDSKIAAIVDTNVVAYYLLGTPAFAMEAREFWRKAVDPLAPAIWEAELTNVVWMSVRVGAVSVAEAPAKLRNAARLGIRSVSNGSLWLGALRRSIGSGVAAYDTLFVELAQREAVPLATFDEKLIRAFPEIARRPRDL